MDGPHHFPDGKHPRVSGEDPFSVCQRVNAPEAPPRERGGLDGFAIAPWIPGSTPA